MAEDILTREPELLAIARTKMPRILFDPLDVLVVDEIGKEFSGSGMDPHITGRPATPYVASTLDVAKLAVLDLSEKTHGNCTGLGLADFCTRQLFEKIDFRAFYTNHLTSTVTLGAKIPMIMETPEMAVQAALKTSNAKDLGHQRVVRIPNTLQLERIFISDALVEEAKAKTDIEILGPPGDWVFKSATQAAPVTA